MNSLLPLKRRRLASPGWAAVLVTHFAAPLIAQANVDLIFSPSVSRVAVAGDFDVDVFARSDGASAQQFGGLEFVLNWDPAIVQFLDSDPNFSDYGWLIDGIIPNDPAGLNDHLDDGDAFYTAVQNFPPPSAPPGAGMRVTRLHFHALAVTTGTTIRFQAIHGADRTHVVGAVFGADATGDFSSVALVRICPQSVNDADDDGIPDECDPVDDNDGVPDASDACPNTPAGQQVNSQGCSCTQLNCDDGNSCTIDACANGICSHPQMNCDDGDPCTTDSCNEGVCVHTPIDCNSHNLCITDACVGGSCVHTPINCSDGNPCTDDTCNNGICIHTNDNANACEDGNPCTDDSCNNGVCIHTNDNSNTCDDGDPCTVDACDSGACIHAASTAPGCTNVFSLPDANGRSVTISAPEGTHVSSASIGANPSPSDTPANAAFPIGFMSFSVSGVGSGGAKVVITLPAGIVANTYFKFGREPDNTVPHWYDFHFDGTTGALFSGNVITLTFIDGKRGDDDLIANGTIVDPGAPAFVTTSVPASPGGQSPSTTITAATSCGACGAGAAGVTGILTPLLIAGLSLKRRRAGRRG